MTNCLSSNSFANLLFVNVQIGDVRATALFDTGAGMTVIAQSLLRRLRAAPEKEVLRAGNNNGVVRASDCRHSQYPAGRCLHGKLQGVRDG